MPSYALHRRAGGFGTRTSLPSMLQMDAGVVTEMLAHCLDGLPDEACGMIGGDAEAGHGTICYPTRNAAASSRIYEVDPRELLAADRDAEDRGASLIGVFHSHTHTPAYPSPTDVAQAPDPDWHYILVSLRDSEPVIRSFRIRDGNITEEPVVITGG